MIFKVGIATSPPERWELYRKEQIWMAMDVIYRGDAQTCRMLETQLITSLKGIRGCYNIQPGGEGISCTADHECAVYFVVAPCGEGVGLTVAYWRRVRALGKDFIHCACG